MGSYEVKNYTHKPDKVEAVLFDGTEECARALYGAGWLDNMDIGLTRDNQGPTTLGKVNTVQGQVTVFPGDYVIKQEDGEKYGIHPDVLAERYEEGGSVDTIEYEPPEDTDPFVQGWPKPEPDQLLEVEPHEPLDGILRDEEGNPMEPTTPEERAEAEAAAQSRSVPGADIRPDEVKPEIQAEEVVGLTPAQIDALAEERAGEEGDEEDVEEDEEDEEVEDEDEDEEA